MSQCWKSAVVAASPPILGETGAWFEFPCYAKLLPCSDNTMKLEAIPRSSHPFGGGMEFSSIREQGTTNLLLTSLCFVTVIP
jgi:hypothetical protein